MKPKNKEKRILSFLKRKGRSSTTRIAAEINSNLWMAKKYLDKLEKEGKIIKEKETNATYWRFRK